MVHRYIPVEALPLCVLDTETQKMKVTIKKKLEAIEIFGQTLLSITAYILIITIQYDHVAIEK